MPAYRIIQSDFECETGDLKLLRGTVKSPSDRDGPLPVLFFCHGFSSFKDWGFYPYITNGFAERGFLTVHCEYSGTAEDGLGDLDRVWNALMNGMLPFAERADLERICFLGHGEGGGAAILFAAAHDAVKGLVTWNGTASAVPTRRDGLLDVPAGLAALNIPVMLVQAGEDSDPMLNGFLKLRAAAPDQTFRFMRGTGHTFGAAHPFAGTTVNLEYVLEESFEFLQEVTAAG